MVRVKQFADDLAISKNQGKNLINKGRNRKDGGSQILESVMKKPIKASKGKAIPADAKGLKALAEKAPDVVKEMGFKMRGGGIAIQGLGFRGIK